MDYIQSFILLDDQSYRIILAIEALKQYSLWTLGPPTQSKCPLLSPPFYPSQTLRSTTNLKTSREICSKVTPQSPPRSLSCSPHPYAHTYLTIHPHHHSNPSPIWTPTTCPA